MKLQKKKIYVTNNKEKIQVGIRSDSLGTFSLTARRGGSLTQHCQPPPPRPSSCDYGSTLWGRTEGAAGRGSRDRFSDTRRLFIHVD